ncbi:MAG: radical SAM protein [Candidatus Adiutrix sp.]
MTIKSRVPQNIPPPRLVAWETTKACNLACRHCRASATLSPSPNELSYERGRDLLNDLATWSPAPMVILSGGEPLLRPDILDLATYGASLNLRMLLSTNGALVTEKLAMAMKKAPISRVSLSLDGLNPHSHDDFRGCAGSFEAIKTSANYFLEAKLPFQINSTITAKNINQAEALTTIAYEMGAVAHHIFLLVPVGRATTMEEPGLSAKEYEAALKALKKREPFLKLEFKATCAPQYQRIGRQMGLQPLGPHGAGKGCLAGQGFMFIDSTGLCQGCGYLPLVAGNINEQKVYDIYNNSPLFTQLRNQKNYLGTCGSCEYWPICGGCRARAHANGDFLGPEPLCPHKPQRDLMGLE